MGKRRTKGEGTIHYDQTRGRWVGQVWIGGQRRKVSAKTKTDAAAKLGALVHGDDSGRHADRRGTVRTVLADWQAKALPGRDLAPSTIEVHRWAADLWADELGAVRLADLDVVAVEAALARMGRKRGGLSRSSLVKARSTLRQALAWAERRRAIGHNPAASAELPNDTAPSQGRRALTADELACLTVALTGHPLAAMFLLSARAGLRPGEAAAVCVDALDLDATPPTVAVVRGVQLKRGRPSVVEELKTRGARRTIALPADLAGALRSHVDEHGITSGLLFPAPNGGPLWPSTARSELAKACDEAGTPTVRPNELRHTAATLWAAQGLPPHHVADLLGHRSTRMVDEVYRHRPPVLLGADEG